MRRFISLVVLSLFFIITNAQESFIAALPTEKKGRMSDPSDDKTVKGDKLYLHKTDVSTGFGSSYSETFKPSILNAVYMMNTYYKKALKRKTVPEDEAQKQYAWILDCAIGICHCSDSKDFELALAKAKDVYQIMSLFNSVKIENN